MTKRLTTEEFIKRSVQQHGDRYNYSLVKYINSNTKVDIICSIHGIFEQLPKHHSKGSNCPKCMDTTKTRDIFIQESVFIHGDKYCYDLVKYVNWKTKVKIICPAHGIFEQTPHNHLHNKGCKKCIGRYKEKYASNNIPTYSVYQPQLEPYGVECRQSPNNEDILEVKCMYCGKWYQPNKNSVCSKIQVIKGNYSGEQNLYCSNNCKKSCPTYNQWKYPKGHGKSGTSREVQPQLRKLVLARDEYQCVRCGKGIDEVQLHCHHLTGVELNPVESADVDNCITLCKEHHKDAHKDIGCRYSDLRKSKC